MIVVVIVKGFKDLKKTYSDSKDLVNRTIPDEILKE